MPRKRALSFTLPMLCTAPITPCPQVLSLVAVFNKCCFTPSLQPHRPLHLSTPPHTHTTDPKAKITLPSRMPESAKSKLCTKGGNFTLTLTSSAPTLAATRRLLGIAAAPSFAPGLLIQDGVDTRKVTVTGWDQMCGGSTLLFLDAVPQGCDLPEICPDVAPSRVASAGNATAATNAAPARGGGAAATLRALLLAAVALAL